MKYPDPASFKREEPVFPKTTPELSYVVDLPKIYLVNIINSDDCDFQPCVLNYVSPEEFLANPREIPAILADVNFQQKVLDCLGCPHDQPLQIPEKVVELKITQDTPACRNVIREMFRTDPERAATLCLTPDGIDVYSFKDENMTPESVF